MLCCQVVRWALGASPSLAKNGLALSCLTCHSESALWKDETRKGYMGTCPYTSPLPAASGAKAGTVINILSSASPLSVSSHPRSARLLRPRLPARRHIHAMHSASNNRLLSPMLRSLPAQEPRTLLRRQEPHQKHTRSSPATAPSPSGSVPSACCSGGGGGGAGARGSGRGGVRPRRNPAERSTEKTERGM